MQAGYVPREVAPELAGDEQAVSLWRVEGGLRVLIAPGRRLDRAAALMRLHDRARDAGDVRRAAAPGGTQPPYDFYDGDAEPVLEP